MKALTTLWELKYKNSETSSNLITDHAGNLIFTYNRYAGDVLRERMNGTLVSISQWGEENWCFIFPENNYMYFKDRIAIYGDNITPRPIATGNMTADLNGACTPLM